MANNYVEFSEIIPRLSEQEQAWWNEQLATVYVFGDREYGEDDLPDACDEDDDLSIDGGLLMRFCTSFVLVVSGECCRRIFRIGVPYMGFSGGGEMMAPGRKFTTLCGPRRERWLAKNRHQR